MKSFTSIITMLVTALWASFVSPLLMPSACGQTEASVAEASPVTVSLVSESAPVSSGQPISVGILVDHAPGWHTYWVNPGATGQATKVTWQLPDGWTAGSLDYALPHVTKTELGLSHEYSGRVLHVCTLQPPASFTSGSQAEIQAAVRYMQCDANGCLPKSAALKLTLAAAAQGQINSAVQADFATTRAQLPVAHPSWQATLSGEGDTYILNASAGPDASTDPGDIYYFERNGVLDAQEDAPKKAAGAITLELFRRSEDSLSDDQKKLQPEGYLYASKGWDAAGKVKAIVVTTSLDPAPSVAPSTLATASGSASSPPGAASGAATGAASGPAVAEISFWQAVFFAFIGGVILNIMPCVFPVLGIKVMGFAQQAGGEPRKIFLHGLVFSLGLLVFVWALVAVLIIAKASFGLELAWGFQTRNAGFLAFIILLLFTLGLNMSGLFEMGTSLTTVGGGLQDKSGYAGSFWSGALTTLVATPCSGPFLGTTLGYALRQNAPGLFVIFTVLGLGIASPYLLLSAMPRLINKLPRPGAWMETFKKAMAFLLYAAALFFLSSFGELTGTDGMTWLLAAAILLAIAAWIYGQWCTPYAPRSSKLKGGAVALLALLGALWFTRDATRQTQQGGAAGVVATAAEAAKAEGFTWIKWSPATLAELQAAGKPVFVDYTSPG